MLKKGQRVWWSFPYNAPFEKQGTVDRDQEGGGSVYVNWDWSPALNPACSCAAYCEVMGAPVYSEDLCRWIIDNVLTEEQLDVVPPGRGASLRFTNEYVEESE